VGPGEEIVTVLPSMRLSVPATRVGVVGAAGGTVAMPVAAAPATAGLPMRTALATLPGFA